MDPATKINLVHLIVAITSLVFVVLGTVWAKRSKSGRNRQSRIAHVVDKDGESAAGAQLTFDGERLELTAADGTTHMPCRSGFVCCSTCGRAQRLRDHEGIPASGITVPEGVAPIRITIV